MESSEKGFNNLITNAIKNINDGLIKWVSNEKDVKF